MTDKKKPEWGDQPMWPGLGAAAFVISPLATLANAFVFLCAWGWFVAPLGVTDITFAHAAGLSSFIAALRFTKMPDDSGITNTKAVRALLYLLLRPLLTLAALYFWHWCMS